MFKFLPLTFLFGLTSFNASAQNLVINGDFETYTTCPTSLLPSGPNNMPVTSWSSPTKGSPDYFNTCAVGTSVFVPYTTQGYQPAQSGNGYCGFDIFTQPPFVQPYREYVQGQLVSPLLAGSSYHFEMYFNRANHCQLAVANMGVYFSPTLTSVSTNWDPLPFIPAVSNTSGIISDSLNWALISGNFIATGGEQYLIIGNFSDDPGTTFLTVDPTAQYNFAYYFVDNVSLTINSGTGIDEASAVTVNAYPNPFGNQLTISADVGRELTVVVYDVTGRKVAEQIFSSKVVLETSGLPSGLYIFEVLDGNILLEKGKVIRN